MSTPEFDQAERDILRSARFQHSSLTQSVKQDAIERIIEQTLGLSTTAMSVDDIVASSSLRIDGGVSILRISEAIEAVDRLRRKGRLGSVKGVAKGEKYLLSKKARLEFKNAKMESERRARKIANKLFKNRVADPESMVAPFFELLGRIFGRLSGTYINVLRGQESKAVLLGSRELNAATEAIIAKFSISNGQGFRHSVEEFFEQSDPDFDTVKWNLAQNYYISLALGLDPSGSLLSRELFDAGCIYLDTNVVVHGVEPSASHHSSFKALVRVCQRMGVVLYVWSDTLNELNRVLDHYMKVVPLAAPKVPAATGRRVRNIFYRLYANAKKTDHNPDLPVLFSNFINARKILEEEHGVHIDSDDWFDRMQKDRGIRREVDRINKHYEAGRGRKKGPLSALHDVLLLSKACTRCRDELKTIVITLDSLLPSFRLTDQSDNALSVGLDAFLQWISPFGVARKDQRDFEALFSEAIRTQVLPQESFFDITDFLVFAEIDWDTKELPATDVEDCVRHLKRVGPTLDPTRPADREKLQYEVMKFFTDPTRKFKKELQRLETRVVELSTKGSEEQRAAEGKISERDEMISRLKDEMDGLKELRRRDFLHRSAVARLLLVIAFFLIGTGAVTLFAHLWGTQANLFEKVIAAWPFYGAIVAGSGILFRVVLGKERIKALSWAMRSVSGNADLE